mgnify:CR=1 FL=1
MPTASQAITGRTAKTSSSANPTPAVILTKVSTQSYWPQRPRLWALTSVRVTKKGAPQREREPPIRIFWLFP